MSFGVWPIIGVCGAVLLSNRSTAFFRVSLVIVYVPVFKGIVYVLGEVKSVNSEMLLKLEE